MSLATRCTSCKTVFRVVQDQLKVSEGWVRCGRCGTVFNALEALFDLERDTPARWQSSQPGALGIRKNSSVRVAPKSGGGGHRSKPAEPPFFARRRSDARPPSPPPDSKPPGHSDFVDAQFDPDVVAHVPPPEPEVTEPMPLRGQPPASQPAVAPVPPSPPAPPLPPPPPPAPPAVQAPAASTAEADTVIADTVIADTVIAGTESPPEEADENYEPATLEFVRLAERQAKWRDPRARLMLAGASAVMMLVLLLQVMHHYRDITAARWPSLAPMLVRWCQTFQCQLQAPRHIESVVVESITLTRSASGNGNFLLSVALHNQGSYAVAMPALDLSLRDANGQLITRRMLTPQALQAKTSVIEPDAEVQVQVTLTEKEQRIVGYTVEAFYP